MNNLLSDDDIELIISLIKKEIIHTHEKGYFGWKESYLCRLEELLKIFNNTSHKDNEE